MKGECVIFLVLLLSVILVAFLNSQTVKAEPSTEGWNKTYGGMSYDFANALVQTGDGGYALAGWTDSFGAGGYDLWLVKTDADGSEQWNRTYGGTSSDVAWALAQTNDGGYALAGYTWSAGTGDSDFWLVKTDAAGSIDGAESGLAWVDSTADTITLYRGAMDPYWNFVLVRIWQPKEIP